MTAGKGVSLFLLFDDGNDSRAFIRALAVEEISQERNREQAKKGDPQNFEKVRPFGGMYEKFKQAQKRIGREYRRRQPVICENQHFFRLWMAKIKPRMTFVYFSIKFVRHAISIPYLIKLCNKKRNLPTGGVREIPRARGRTAYPFPLSAKE